MEEIGRSATSGLMQPRTMTGMAAGALLAGLAVVYKFPPTEYAFYPRCPFYATTHWLCPGCGSTRALHALLHADLQAALHYNFLFTLLAPFVLAWLGFCCYRVMRYDQFPRFVIPRGLAAGLIAAVMLFTVARNTFFAF
jgi:Protein of unknown function (DUF2752)